MDRIFCVLLSSGFFPDCGLGMPPPAKFIGVKGLKRDHSVSLPAVRIPGGRVRFSPVPGCWEANVEMLRDVLSKFRGLKDVWLVRASQSLNSEVSTKHTDEINHPHNVHSQPSSNRPKKRTKAKVSLTYCTKHQPGCYLS